MFGLLVSPTPTCTVPTVAYSCCVVLSASEPEVQILLALAKELKPHLWLNVHSGMYALFTPYDHKPYVPNGTNAQAAIRMMQRIKDLSCPRCVVGSGGHSVG
jgi:hypothetical protein